MPRYTNTLQTVRSGKRFLCIDLSSISINSREIAFRRASCIHLHPCAFALHKRPVPTFKFAHTQNGCCNNINQACHTSFSGLVAQNQPTVSPKKDSDNEVGAREERFTQSKRHSILLRGSKSQGDLCTLPSVSLHPENFSCSRVPRRVPHSINKNVSASCFRQPLGGLERPYDFSPRFTVSWSKENVTEHRTSTSWKSSISAVIQIL